MIYCDMSQTWHQHGKHSFCHVVRWLNLEETTQSFFEKILKTKVCEETKHILISVSEFLFGLYLQLFFWKRLVWQKITSHYNTFIIRSYIWKLKAAKYVFLFLRKLIFTRRRNCVISWDYLSFRIGCLSELVQIESTPLRIPITV